MGARDWPTEAQFNAVTAAEAAAFIASGQRIYVQGGCATPNALLRAGTRQSSIGTCSLDMSGAPTRDASHSPDYNDPMADRLFTIEEARALLPTVRQLLSEIQAAKGEVDAKGADMARLLALTGGNGHLQNDLSNARGAVEAAAGRLQDRIAELEDIGVELKGLDEGLCDFPSMREDRVVYLCFRLGEDDIEFWHELDTGFTGRQPL